MGNSQSKKVRTYHLVLKIQEVIDDPNACYYYIRDLPHSSLFDDIRYFNGIEDETLRYRAMKVELSNLESILEYRLHYFIPQERDMRG